MQAARSIRLVSLGAVALLAGACQKSSENDAGPEKQPSIAASESAPERSPAAANQVTAPSETAALPAASTPPELAAPPDVAAPPADAKKTPSGLASKVLKPGTGKVKPTLNDRVTVHYTGWTTDGKMFDSSIPRNEPTSFGVTGVIKGWTEGLQLMVVGEKRRFWIPAELAYGKTPRMGAPAGNLTFDVELLEIQPAPETPKDVAKPPADAKKTPSGLAYKSLKKGTGKDHPTAASRVTVHYTGWTTDGKMFDSSVVRGQPTTFSLGQVIPGWTEGVQLMVVGDKMRFWIPGKLAYGDTPTRPGSPAGPLVFDIELLDVK
jgi:FKBP-type peptidyl-prolyl cis-trans isomerase